MTGVRLIMAWLQKHILIVCVLAVVNVLVKPNILSPFMDILILL